MRWEDDIERREGLTWKRQAQNGDTCKEIGETYIRKWIEEVREEDNEYNILTLIYFNLELSSKTRAFN